jgi:hypothetical protein
MTMKPANPAVTTHPAIKPANITGDIFFIFLILLGAAGIRRNALSKVADFRFLLSKFR